MLPELSGTFAQGFNDRREMMWFKPRKNLTCERVRMAKHFDACHDIDVAEFGRRRFDIPQLHGRCLDKEIVNCLYGSLPCGLASRFHFRGSECVLLPGASPMYSAHKDSGRSISLVAFANRLKPCLNAFASIAELLEFATD